MTKTKNCEILMLMLYSTTKASLHNANYACRPRIFCIPDMHVGPVLALPGGLGGLNPPSYLSNPPSYLSDPPGGVEPPPNKRNSPNPPKWQLEPPTPPQMKAPTPPNKKKFHMHPPQS